MKVVHINTLDIVGGAAIAAHRLHLLLLEKGIDSKMLVMSKSSDELSIELAKEGKLEKFIFSNFRKFREKLIFEKYKSRDRSVVFSTGKYGIDISKHPYINKADTIHLHWINGGYLSLKDLKKLGKLNKKIIWTLHDMWAFTGGCHYSNWCDKYVKQCGNCHILKSNKDNDITRKIWKQKEKIIKNLDLHIITCSEWLGECAKKSSLLKNKNIEVIPNILDKNVFKPIDQYVSREILNLDKNKKYICFGAINSTTDLRKGYKYMKKALEILAQKDYQINNDLELLIFGTSYSKYMEDLPFRTNFLGKISDEHTLAIIYNSVDVFVGPSLEDNLPNTILESLHCGTPVVSFDVGGLPDMVDHKKNGYLAKYKDSADLANGIKWTLENLKKVRIEKKELSGEKVLEKLLEVYRS